MEEGGGGGVLIPIVMTAHTTIVLVMENFDLCVSLKLPGRSDTKGLSPSAKAALIFTTGSRVYRYNTKATININTVSIHTVPSIFIQHTGTTKRHDTKHTASPALSARGARRRGAVPTATASRPPHAARTLAGSQRAARPAAWSAGRPFPRSTADPFHWSAQTSPRSP